MGNEYKSYFESWIWFKIPFLILFTILIVLGIDAYYYTDKEMCEDYMKVNSNLTYGQGQKYYVEANRCHEYLDTGWGVAHWSVPMNEVSEMNRNTK